MTHIHQRYGMRVVGQAVGEIVLGSESSVSRFLATNDHVAVQTVMERLNLPRNAGRRTKTAKRRSATTALTASLNTREDMGVSNGADPRRRAIAVSPVGKGASPKRGETKIDQLIDGWFRLPRTFNQKTGMAEGQAGAVHEDRRDVRLFDAELSLSIALRYDGGQRFLYFLTVLISDRPVFIECRFD
jgi:hypothetical protein